MVELTTSQRAVLVDKLPDAGNLAAGALFFGQFLGGETFSASLAFFGIAVWAFLIACAVALAGGTQA